MGTCLQSSFRRRFGFRGSFSSSSLTELGRTFNGSMQIMRHIPCFVPIAKVKLDLHILPVVCYAFLSVQCSKRMAHSPVPAEDKFAAYILRLASGKTYRELGYEFDMCLDHVRVSINLVASVLVDQFQGEISLPSREEAVRIRDVFQARFGIADCVGAMDGTHIRLRPSVAIRQAQYNHKQFHSFVLHALVDSK